MSLDLGAMHILNLAKKEAKEDGWARVSDVVWPLLEKVPAELLDREPDANGGRCRLTHDGQVVLKWFFND
jgi:hypothetical protein